MTETLAEIFDHHASCYAGAEPSLAPPLEAARDFRLTTPYLLDRAIDDVNIERVGDDSIFSFPLLVLQQRADAEVLDSAILFLESDDAAARQLGAKILRELPSIDLAPYPHSRRAVSCLEKLVAKEKDEEVLRWALAAIGWQGHPAGTEVLLRFVDDKRAFVRRVVGNNVANACEDGEKMPDEVANALLTLATDPDSDIRWSVFYDIAENPGMFVAHRNAFEQAARVAKEDSVENVREQASRAHEALV